jgi:DNA polymerase sigma
LHWLKEALFEQHPAEFTELQILTETKYIRISFVHAQTDLKVTLNVNNIAGIFNSKLIGHFNSVDVRFHKISILLIRWHKEFLHFKDLQFAFPSHVESHHLINVYSLQLMLATWMQHIG